MAVVSGLSQFPVSRLKGTWRLLSSSYEAKWKELESIINPINNFKTLRELQQDAETPLIPSLSIF